MSSSSTKHAMHSCRDIIHSTRNIIQTASNSLKEAGCDSPRLDADLLLMSAWNIQRTELIIRASEPVPETIRQTFNALVQRRMQREPLAYILAEKEFWSRAYYVCPDVLIPRPETEHLIEAVLEHFPDRQARLQFCDIGTGSGCIAITLACEYPNAQITATDISHAALAIAKKNALRHQVEQRISFKQGDMLAALQVGEQVAAQANNQDDIRCDAIICNPPYVAEHEMVALEQELSHEPRHALTDGGDGLLYLRSLLRDAASYLHPNGLLIVETGPCGLPSDTTSSLHLEHQIRDLAGHTRGGVYSLIDSACRRDGMRVACVNKHG